MTSNKQIAANQANSQKSTGAKTEQGKQVVSINAVTHGIFSSRLIMSFESADEYGQLLDGLIESLHPEGSVEALLVEKVAVSMWRQLRLTRAESASIEMSQSIYDHQIRQQVQNITSDRYDTLMASDFAPATEEQIAQIAWCKVVLDEFALLDDDRLEAGDMAILEGSPEIKKQFEAEAKEDACDTLQEYIDSLAYDLDRWVRDLADWSQKELAKIEHKALLNDALKIVQAKVSVPITNPLLIRYQIALDGELYKALEALRKQQEWRLKRASCIETEYAAV